MQAIGKVSHQLMQTIFPAPLEEINAELLRTGRWEGELVHARREGPPLVVASRWSLQRDDRGRPVAILETNNDITDRKRAEDALRRSQAYLTEAQRLSHTGSWAFERREPAGHPLVRGTPPPVRVRSRRGYAGLGDWAAAHPSRGPRTANGLPSSKVSVSGRISRWITGPFMPDGTMQIRPGRRPSCFRPIRRPRRIRGYRRRRHRAQAGRRSAAQGADGAGACHARDDAGRADRLDRP